MNLKNLDLKVIDIRADDLFIGAVFLHANVYPVSTVSAHKVTSIELEGDDIVINGTITTSRGNLVTVVRSVD